MNLKINDKPLLNPGYYKYILSSLILLIIVGNIIYHVFYYDDYEFAENVESVDWLPQSANNISFYIYHKSNVYEFSIEENEFLDWVKDKGLIVKKIERGPVAITRYNFYADFVSECFENMSEEEQYQEWKSRTEASIENGYLFEGKSEAEGKMKYGSYDLEAKKVYYEAL